MADDLLNLIIKANVGNTPQQIDSILKSAEQLLEVFKQLTNSTDKVFNTKELNQFSNSLKTIKNSIILSQNSISDEISNLQFELASLNNANEESIERVRKQKAADSPAGTDLRSKKTKRLYEKPIEDTSNQLTSLQQKQSQLNSLLLENNNKLKLANALKSTASLQSNSEQSLNQQYTNARLNAEFENKQQDNINREEQNRRDALFQESLNKERIKNRTKESNDRLLQKSLDEQYTNARLNANLENEQKNILNDQEIKRNLEARNNADAHYKDIAKYQKSQKINPQRGLDFEAALEFAGLKNKNGNLTAINQQNRLPVVNRDINKNLQLWLNAADKTAHIFDLFSARGIYSAAFSGSKALTLQQIEGGELTTKVNSNKHFIFSEFAKTEALKAAGIRTAISAAIGYATYKGVQKVIEVSRQGVQIANQAELAGFGRNNINEFLNQKNSFVASGLDEGSAAAIPRLINKLGFNAITGQGDSLGVLRRFGISPYNKDGSFKSQNELSTELQKNLKAYIYSDADEKNINFRRQVAEQFAGNVGISEEQLLALTNEDSQNYKNKSISDISKTTLINLRKNISDATKTSQLKNEASFNTAGNSFFNIEFPTNIANAIFKGTSSLFGTNDTPTPQSRYPNGTKPYLLDLTDKIKNLTETGKISSNEINNNYNYNSNRHDETNNNYNSNRSGVNIQNVIELILNNANPNTTISLGAENNNKDINVKTSIKQHANQVLRNYNQ